MALYCCHLRAEPSVRVARLSSLAETSSAFSTPRSWVGWDLGDHCSTLLSDYIHGDLVAVTVLSRCWLGTTSDHPQDQAIVVTHTQPAKEKGKASSPYAFLLFSLGLW